MKALLGMGRPSFLLHALLRRPFAFNQSLEFRTSGQTTFSALLYALRPMIDSIVGRLSQRNLFHSNVRLLHDVRPALELCIDRGVQRPVECPSPPISNPFAWRQYTS